MLRIERLLAHSICAAAVAAVFALPPAQAADWQAGAGPEWAKVMAAAKQEGKVVVAGPPALARAFTEDFKRDTGIDLEYVGGNTREIGARFGRELDSGHLTLDVSLGGGSELLTAYPQGRLVALKPQMMLPGVTGGKNWAGGKIKWMDNAGAYFFQGSNWVYCWPLFNSKLVPAGSVKSWKDLLKPEFKGKIAAFDPRSGGPGQAAAAYLAEALGIDFLKALYIGQNVVYTRDGRQLIDWAAHGKYAVALGGVQVDIEYFKHQGIQDFDVPTLPDGPGSAVGGFSVIKEGKGAPHPNAATVFINWYASQPGQEAYTRVMLEPSTRLDVQVPEVPDYVKVKPGVHYLDQYREDWYTKTRPQLAKAVVQALGGR